MPEHDYLETEIKILVPAVNDVAERLESLGAVKTKPRVFERNMRYEDADESLTPSGIVLRLREDSAVRLTYKEPVEQQADLQSTVRFEAEVEVSSFDTMAIILERLGYKPHIVYEKYRTTYEWRDVEIVLDEMPYGHFIEIEGTDDNIGITIQALALEAAPRFKDDYLTLFGKVRQRMGLEFHDLTFENFAGIEVPLSVFLDDRNPSVRGAMSDV
ncbi:MAG: class IV adenylate cyclase [Chloroflexota bacterium]